MSTGSERRKGGGREALSLKVEYPGAAELVADFTENISAGGTFILTQRELAIGDRVRLALSFPNLIQPVLVDAVVRWVRREPASDRGVGLEFDVASPGVTRLRDLVDRVAAADPAVVARTLRVLIVEDNPHVATLVREGLTAGGRRQANQVTFLTTTVTNGGDALEALRDNPYDLLIIDIYIPVLDGEQVIRRVRADAALSFLPIIAVSAGGPTARAAAYGAGADFFIDKPMRLAEVIQTVRKVLGLV